MADSPDLKQYDKWFDEFGPAAITRRVVLTPVEGDDAVIFPPTYPIDKEDKAGYNIDELPSDELGGRPVKVAQIDSVGSQANRVESRFSRPPLDKLVPQIVVTAGDHRVNLLDAGHRAADAVVRCSSLGEKIGEAMLAIKQNGNAVPLAKIGPTSLVFGFWDSRETQVKVPRVVRSVIRAHDVDVLRRSAQYSTTAGVILDGEKVEATVKGKKAERGFAHVPAVHAHGGVLIRKGGEIRRDAILNLSALRSLYGVDEKETLELRRYILGVALVAFTMSQPTSLREGCELVPKLDSKAKHPLVSTKLVTADGQRADLSLTSDEALDFAMKAASVFGVGKGGDYPFDKKVAAADLKKGKG